MLKKLDQRKVKDYSLISFLVIFVIALYTYFYSFLKLNPLTHNIYDTYTRQALQWSKGKVYLDENIEHLELSIYKNKYFISFPPVPTITEVILVPFFRQETPNTLVTLLYTVGSMITLTLLAKHFKRPLLESVIWGIFIPLSSNLFSLSLSGSVWFTAQALSFLLSCLSIFYIFSAKPKHWHASLLFWALSIGCRPLQIVFGPFLFYKVFSRVKTIPKLLPYFLLPGLVAIVLGWYNFIRFDNPLEFGHIYLPVHVTTGDPQFSPRYVWTNLQNILRLPTLNNGTIDFPLFGGFAFYIANPIFIVLLERVVTNFKTVIKDPSVLLLLFCLVLHFTSNLTHNSFGGFQFGTRYLIDAIPFIVLAIFYMNPKLKSSDVVILFFGLLLNIYGAYYLYSNW